MSLVQRLTGTSAGAPPLVEAANVRFGAAVGGPGVASGVRLGHGQKRVQARSDPHQRWMAVAIAEAERAREGGEVPIGAAVVLDDRLVAASANASIARVDPTAHAEVLALRMAAQQIGNYRLAGCDLYVTVEPCVMCVGAAIQARIRTLVFGCLDPKGGAAGSLYNVAQDPRLNHQIAVVPGVEQERCRALLQEFFASRRG